MEAELNRMRILNTAEQWNAGQHHQEKDQRTPQDDVGCAGEPASSVIRFHGIALRLIPCAPDSDSFIRSDQS